MSCLSGVYVYNVDIYNQEDICKICKNGFIFLLKGNKLNVKVKNRKNSDCKFIGYVIEELKVKGWFKFCFVIDFL